MGHSQGDSSAANDSTSVLATFELRLEQPIVPGELRVWILDVASASKAAIKAIMEKTLPHHQALLDRIDGFDSDLANRVSRLRDKEQALLVQAEQLQEEVEQLALRAEELDEEEENSLQGCAEQFIEVGLKWIIAVRTQDAAVSTWYQEALQRDRGFGD